MAQKTFEDVEPIIESILNKARSRWKLQAVKHYSYDDFKQHVKVHIWQKFHLWDQSRPFENWCSTVIHNQMENKKKELWLNHDKPCTDCYFNKGMGACSYTTDGRTQNPECHDFKEWENKGRYAHELKNASSVEDEDGEVFYSSTEEIDYEGFIKKLHAKVSEHLEQDLISRVTYKIFIYSFVEKLSDDEISRKMGYKSNEKNRQSGYRILSIHRKTIQDIAQEMLEKEEYRFI